MNGQNYASLEASKRLVDAGIALETEACRIIWTNGYVELCRTSNYFRAEQDCAGVYRIPAPSMAEVWRELPEDTGISKSLETNFAEFVDSEGYRKGPAENTNPTDALIDLLILVRKEAT